MRNILNTDIETLIYWGLVAKTTQKPPFKPILGHFSIKKGVFTRG
jgi:hypothetical protein